MEEDTASEGGTATPPLPPKEAIRSATNRVRERLARAKTPPNIALPEEKGDFPKVLCLDYNKWIDLARAHYQRPDGSQWVAALDQIRVAVVAGKLLVPIMPSNLHEAAEPMNEDRRKRAADFMVETSGNTCWMHSVTTSLLEAERAVRKHFLGHSTLAAIRPNLLHWGMDMAAAGYPLDVYIADESASAIANQVLREPEFSKAFLAHALSRETIHRHRENSIQAAERMAQVRATNAPLPPARRRALEMLSLFEAGAFAERIQFILGSLDVPFPTFMEWLKTGRNLLELTGDMPGIDTQFTIVEARDRNSQDKSQANDFKDVELLKQAIPYGNIVVTENRWAHLANAGLAKKYGTRVIASLRDLPAVLRDEGCA
jgi:hypothetical protein